MVVFCFTVCVYYNGIHLLVGRGIIQSKILEKICLMHVSSGEAKTKK